MLKLCSISCRNSLVLFIFSLATFSASLRKFSFLFLSQCPWKHSNIRSTAFASRFSDHQAGVCEWTPHLQWLKFEINNVEVKIKFLLWKFLRYASEILIFILSAKRWANPWKLFTRLFEWKMKIVQFDFFSSEM